MYVDSLVCFDCIGDSKIDEFEKTFDQDKIVGFEIGVNDIMFVDCFDTFQHLLPVMSNEAGIEFGGL